LLQGRRVWCVDDDSHSCVAARALLERWGCEVPYAGGHRDALATARHGEAPDLLLLDLHLGGTDGVQVHAALAAAWGTSPPVILLTADRSDPAQALARAHGWEFLPKPVRPPALRALMSQLLLRAA
jgi:histidine kinase